MIKGAAAFESGQKSATLTEKNEAAPEVLISRYYQRHFDEIFIFINQHVQRFEDSQDLTHDVFAKALNYLKRSEIKIENPRAWLYQIARTHCIDSVYKKKRLQTEYFSPGEEKTFIQPGSFEDSLADQEMVDLVIEWVDKNTSESERRIFELKILCGLTLTEIGKTLRCDASTVSRILANLIERIKREFI